MKLLGIEVILLERQQMMKLSKKSEKLKCWELKAIMGKHRESFGQRMLLSRAKELSKLIISLTQIFDQKVAVFRKTKEFQGIFPRQGEFRQFVFFYNQVGLLVFCTCPLTLTLTLCQVSD